MIDLAAVLFDLGLILVGALIEMLIEEVFKGSVRGPMHYAFQKLRLSLVKDIDVEVRREGRADLSGVEPESSYATALEFLDRITTALQKDYINIERKGESILVAHSQRDADLEARVEAILPEKGDADESGFTVVIAVKAKTGYIGLVECLFGIINEVDRLGVVVSGQGVPTEFRLGRGAVTIGLKKAPTVVAVLSKLGTSQLRTEFPQYKMDMSPTGIVFRGDLTTDTARQIKQIVTWYY